MMNVNNPKEFLSKLSDEEFRQLLETAGFNVEDGEGKIIFTENHFDEVGAVKITFTETHHGFHFESEGNGLSYSLTKKVNYKIKNNPETTISFDFVA